MADEELQAKITLDEQQFSVAANKVVAQLGALDGAVQGLGTKLENALDKSLGKVSGQLQGLSLDNVASRLSQAADKMQAAFVGTVQPAIEFEAAMRNVNTVAKLSEEDLAGLSDQMRTLGREIGIGIAPTEAAAAQYEILSAGFENAADATEILKQAAIASKGGLTTTANAADLLTSSLKAYGAGADQAKRFSDVLFTGVEKGKLTFDDFVAGLGSVVPAAAANNVSLEELSAAMAALTTAGQQPARAFTGLNAAIVQLSSPTKEARTAAAGLGIDLDSAAFKGLSLVEKLQALALAAGDNKSALRAVLGDVNALGVAYSLAGNGASTYQSAIEAMNGPLDASANAARENSKSFAAAKQEFDAAAQALKIALSGAILPALTKLAKVGTEIIHFFDDFSPGAKAAAGAVAGVGTALAVAGAVLGKFLFGAQGLAGVLGVQIPLSTAAAGNAYTALSGRVAAARTAITSFNFAAAAGPGFLAALGVGLILAAKEYVNMQQSALAAADAIETVGGKALKGTTADFSTGELLSTPVADLKKKGASKEDVQNRIRELRETLEDTVDTAARNKLQEKIDQLIEVREQLATTKEIEKKAAGPNKNVEEFLKNRKAPAEDPKAIEERRKQALFEIENAKLTGEERIKQLEAFLAKEKLVGDERRSIEKKIFDEREKLEKSAADAAKKAVDDKIADSLQEIDLSKASHQAKIQQLGELAKKYQDNADLQRRLRDLIAREEEAADKDREDRKKKAADDAKKAQEAANQRTQEERQARGEAIGLRQDAISSEISKQQDKGGAGAISAIGSLLQERQRLTEESIRLQLAEQIAAAKSDEAKVQFSKNAEERIRQEQLKTAEEFKRLKDEQVAKAKEAEEKLKPKKATSTEFTGGVLTVEELAKQSEARFGSGVGQDFDARRAATDAARKARTEQNIAQTLAGAQAKGIDLAKVLPQSKIAGLPGSFQGLPPKVGSGTAPSSMTAVRLEVDIKIDRGDGTTETRTTTLTGVGYPASGPGSTPTTTRGRVA